jgi:hypothetical protein
MSNANVTKVVISESTEQKVWDALQTLHTLIGTYNGAPAISFEDTVRQGKVKDLSVRAMAALSDASGARRAAKIAAYSGAVAEVVEAHMVAGRAAIAAVNALPAEVRALVSIKRTCFVPLSEVYDIFPQDMSTSDKNALLTTMGYKMGKESKDAPLALACEIK